jgi:hypothetical protein
MGQPRGLGCEVLVGLLGQRGDRRSGQSPPSHVGQSFSVDHVLGVAGTEQIEEVAPTFAGRRAEPGEMIVADLGARAVAGLVARASVIDADPGGIGEAGAQHVAGFAEEAILALDQQAHDLALGHIDADGMQLRQQPTHRHLALVILGEDEAAQLRSEMFIDPGGKRGRDGLPIRCPPALTAIPRDIGVQHQVLHHETLVALEARIRRGGDLEHLILMDDPSRRLLAPTAPVLALAGRRLWLGCRLHPAGLDRRAPGQSLQPRDLVTLGGHSSLQFAHPR